MSRIRGLVIIGVKLGDAAGPRLGEIVGFRLEALAGAKLGDIVGLRLDALAGAKLEALVGFKLGGVVGFELGGIPLVLRVNSKRASDLTESISRAEGGSVTFSAPRVSCEPTGGAPAAPVAPVHDTMARRHPHWDAAHHE